MKIEPGQAVLGVVGQLDGVRLVVERHHRDHRAEDLLAPDPRRRVLGGDHARRHPEAVAAGRRCRRTRPRPRRGSPAPSPAAAPRSAGPSRWSRRSGRAPAARSRPARAAATNSSYADRSTRIRERAQQSWPALSKTAYGAAAAAAAMSASAKTMLALLPPSSRVTRFTWSAQPAMICLPTSVEPVKQTLRTSGWVTNRSPTTEPLPGMHGEHVLGQPGLERQLAEPDRGERGQLGRLEHHGVAGRQRRREAPAGDRHREVPRAR